VNNRNSLRSLFLPLLGSSFPAVAGLRSLHSLAFGIAGASLGHTFFIAKKYAKS